MHYTRWLRHGDAEYQRPGRKPIVTADGYVLVWAPGHPTAFAGGYAPEHRKVAWDEGILTDLTLDVHHKNGVKADNHPDNLAVLTHGEHSRLHPSWNSLKTHCKRGHAYSGDNLYVDKRGWRICRECLAPGDWRKTAASPSG